MTQDALLQGNNLLKQINTAQNLKNKHLAVVKSSFPELTSEQQGAISATLSSIHEAVITALQTQLTNLSGTYTAPAQTT
jgi:hypothetical protein